MGILNGTIEADEEGQDIYVRARGETATDYVIEGRKMREKKRKLKVEEKVDSDHMSIVVQIKEKRERRKQMETIRGNKSIKRMKWGVEVGEKFRKETEEWKIEYRIRKRAYRTLCEGKKEKRGEERIREVGGIRKGRGVWELIRRKRGRKGEICDEFKEEEWKEYFMNLLGKVEVKVSKGGKRKREEGVKGLERSEIERAIKKLKCSKVVGENGVEDEVWK